MRSTCCSGSSTRSCAGAPALARSRSPTSSSSVQMVSSRPSFTRDDTRARGRALRCHRPDPSGGLPADAERVRLLGVPSPRSTSCARRPEACLRRIATVTPCESRRCTTSTAICPLLRLCSPRWRTRTSTPSFRGATSCGGRLQSECLTSASGRRSTGSSPATASVKSSLRPTTARLVRPAARRRGDRDCRLLAGNGWSWTSTVGTRPLLPCDAEIRQRDPHQAHSRPRGRGGSGRRRRRRRRLRPHPRSAGPRTAGHDTAGERRKCRTALSG